MRTATAYNRVPTTAEISLVKCNLDHGKARAIPAAELGRRAGFLPERNDHLVRAAIFELQKGGFPAIACGAGFFIAETMEEIQAYEDSLESRIEALEARLAVVRPLFV